MIDRGQGIPHLEHVLNGTYKSTTGMGLGMTGARRLMDDFQIDTASGRGTTIVMRKTLSPRASVVTEERLGQILHAIRSRQPAGIAEEFQRQNQELLRALDDLQSRQEELVRLNRELEDTNRGVVALYAELDEKADHLRRADELKSRFLSNMTHEFRTPVNSIIGLCNLLAEDRQREGREVEQEVVYIRKAAEQLGELVNDLLDLAKVEAGKTSVRPAPVDISKLFGALRGMLRPLLLNQAVALVFDAADDLPTLTTDEAKVSQILRNLISNALKFTERGEVRVAASLAADRPAYRVHGQRHRHRHRPGGPAAHLRRVHADRASVAAWRARYRPGTAALETAGGTAGRHAQPGQRARRRFHLQRHITQALHRARGTTGPRLHVAAGAGKASGPRGGRRRRRAAESTKSS